MAGALVLVALSPDVGTASPGDLDSSFGTDGLAQTSFTPTVHTGTAIARQADGKLLVGGTAGNDFAVTRLNYDGSVDTSFGSGGLASFPVGSGDSYVRGIVIDPLGRIIVAGGADNGGSYEFGVARMLSNGTLDSAFGQGGVALIDFGVGLDLAEDVTTLADGSVVVVGRAEVPSGYQMAIAKTSASGQLDPMFGNGGLVTVTMGPLGYSDGSAVHMASDGKILVAGTSDSTDNPSDARNFALVRLNSNGSLDTAFASGGVAAVDLGFGQSDDANDMVIQPDGRAVVVGTTGDNLLGFGTMAVARYTTDGQLDQAFGFGGSIRVELMDGPIGIDTARAVVLDQVERIVVGGTSESNSTLVRFQPDGTRDFTFGQNGQPTLDHCSCVDDLNDLIVQPDGRIVIVGHEGGAVDGEPTFIAARFIGGDEETPSPSPSPTASPAAVGAVQASSSRTRRSNRGLRSFSRCWPAPSLSRSC